MLVASKMESVDFVVHYYVQERNQPYEWHEFVGHLFSAKS